MIGGMTESFVGGFLDFLGLRILDKTGAAICKGPEIGGDEVEGREQGGVDLGGGDDSTMMF